MKARNFRKRDIEKEDEAEEGGASLSDKLIALRAEQRDRLREGGMPLLEGALPIASPQPQEAVEVVFGNMKKFSGEGAAIPVVGSQTGTLQQKMEKFIEARITAAKSGSDGSKPGMGVAADEKPTENQGTGDMWEAIGGSGTCVDRVRPEDIIQAPEKLYTVPEHLRVPGRTSTQLALTEKDSGTGTGGMILGGTGIAEVSVPSSWKSRAEAETEEAKAKLLERKARIGYATIAAGGSLSVNFNAQRREYAIAQREEGHHNKKFPAQLSHAPTSVPWGERESEGKRESKGNGDSSQPLSKQDRQQLRAMDPRKLHANDDTAFKRFKKSELDRSKNR